MQIQIFLDFTILLCIILWNSNAESTQQALPVHEILFHFTQLIVVINRQSYILMKTSNCMQILTLWVRAVGRMMQKTLHFASLSQAACRGLDGEDLARP